MTSRLDYPRLLYIERQRTNQPLYLLIMPPIAGVLLAVAYFAWRDVPGGPPLQRYGAIFAVGLMVTVAVMLVLMLFIGGLTVSVTSEQLILRYNLVVYIWRRTIAMDNIVNVQVETYEPIREFLGWGIRFSLRNFTTGYTVSGNRAVRIELKGGPRVLIGSKHPEALAEAIHSARGATTMRNR